MRRWLLAAALVGGIACAGESPDFRRLPEKILSGYSGYFLGGDPDALEESLFRPMGEASFNSVEVKIQWAKQRGMDPVAAEAEIARLAEGANKHGLAFQVYLYPEPHHGRRMAEWPEHAAVPARVDETGTEIPTAFALAHPDAWRRAFHHARGFAELSTRLPIAALKIDIETIGNGAVSYDDYAWAAFSAEHPAFDADLARDRRAPALDAAEAKDAYAAFYRALVEKAIRAWADDLHAVNPGLVLGMMPFEFGWLGEAFARRLATDTTPAIIDDWCMYNGEGFDDKVLARQAHVKKLHPNNLFVPWFRGNSYESEDMASLAYHAGARCDGYSIWVMRMFDEKHNKGSGYNLPGGRTGAQYYAAYKEGNDAVLRDLAEGTINDPQRIALKKAKVLVPPLDGLADVAIPELEPVGSGALAGSVRMWVLREQRTLYIHAKAGEPIKITLSHRAGAARQLALHYAVLDRAGATLRRESVTPGATDTFELNAPETGVYALVVTGGIGGQAWYGVEIHNAHFALDAGKPAYFFGPQTFFAAGPDRGNPVLRVAMGSRQGYTLSVAGGATEAFDGDKAREIPLADGFTKFSFGKTAKPGLYSQDFFITFPKGSAPYLFSSPERALLPAKR